MDRIRLSVIKDNNHDAYTIEFSAHERREYSLPSPNADSPNSNKNQTNKNHCYQKRVLIIQMEHV